MIKAMILENFGNYWEIYFNPGIISLLSSPARKSCQVDAANYSGEHLAYFSLAFNKSLFVIPNLGFFFTNSCNSMNFSIQILNKKNNIPIHQFLLLKSRVLRNQNLNKNFRNIKNLFFKMKVFTRSLVFCLFIVQSLNGKLDEIVEEESASRKSINMSFENYQSYPFGISDGKKQFVLTFPSQEKIQGEIFLYWTDGNSSLVDPYQSDIETQFITLTIKATETGETIAFKKFHTQAGFSFTAHQLKNYKIEFENHGIHPKMIDFSISYITPQKILEMSDVATWIEKSNTMSGHLLKQLQGIFNLWEQIMIVNQNEQHSKQRKIHQLLFSCLWEVLVIITLGIIQIYMFKKLMNDVSFV